MSTELAPLPLGKPSGVLDIVQHLREIWDLADILVRSRMIPNSINTPEAAAAIILKGHELGIGPMQAFDSISVIQGKPTISPQLMVALVERSGQLEDKQVAETPDSCTITLKRRGRTPVVTTFTKAEANAMGLTGKDNWRKQFSVMLYWRCEAKANRRVFPDVIAGCYTPEEMGADVTEDGGIGDRVARVQVHHDPIQGEVAHIDGEVIEDDEEAEARRATRQSAPGLFTKEQVAKTRAFNDWMSRRCDATNEAWAAEWHSRLDGAFEAGFAIPQTIHPVINPWQAKAHLLKWAIATSRLPDVKAEAQRTRQVDAYVASVFYNGEHDKAALKAEMSGYVAEQRREKSDAIYRKYPDLAPEGWADEQREAQEAQEEEAQEDERRERLEDHATLVEPEPEVHPIPSPYGDGPPPCTGTELRAWMKLMEDRFDCHLRRYINHWAKLAEFPVLMNQWTVEQVEQGHQVALRKLRFVAEERDAEQAELDHGDAWEPSDQDQHDADEARGNA